jgi:hypothetical protein
MTAQSTQPMADHRPAAAAALAASLVFAAGIAFGAIAGLNVRPAAAPAPVSIGWSGTNPDAAAAPAPASLRWTGTNPDATSSSTNVVQPTKPWFQKVQDATNRDLRVRKHLRTDRPIVVTAPTSHPRAR